MAYSKRIGILCSLLEKTHIFADVGCDHGYCTEYMLKNGLCDFAIFSDVSQGSLNKAKTLLGKYEAEGKAKAVLGDGFFGVDKDCDEVLIAGMGGNEIISILSDKKHGFMPKKFVFQPMKDQEKLRRYIVENGGYIQKDFMFKDDKFYDVLVGGKGENTRTYSDLDYEFGKDNLLSPNDDFIEHIEILIKNADIYLLRENMKECNREELQKRKEKLLGVLSNVRSRRI